MNKQVLRVKLDAVTMMFWNRESQVWVDLEDCTETADGTLIDPSGFEVEIIN